MPTWQENHLGRLLDSLPEWPPLVSEVAFGPESGLVHWTLTLDHRASSGGLMCIHYWLFNNQYLGQVPDSFYRKHVKTRKQTPLGFMGTLKKSLCVTKDFISLIDISAHSEGAANKEHCLLQTICVSWGGRRPGRWATPFRGPGALGTRILKWACILHLLISQQARVQANSCVKLQCMFTQKHTQTNPDN